MINYTDYKNENRDSGAPDELHKSTRAAKILRESNKAMVCVSNESDLLKNICQIIVKEGGYRLAWVGFAMHDEKKTVKPITYGGFEEGYLELVNITWADEENGRGPTGTAIRTGKPCVVKNTQSDPKFKRWKEQAQKHGYSSSIALPLILDSDIIGSLNIYASEIDAFDDYEIELLIQLANDITFGIKSLRTKTAKGNKENKLLKRNQELILLQADFEELFLGTIKVLSNTIDAKSEWTAGHSERVTKHAVEIGKGIGLGERSLKELEVAGLLHDIGKIETYIDILDKKEGLTSEEIELIRRHPIRGAEILSPIKQLNNIIPAVKHHHEFYDGTGYPDGLKGQKIPLYARVLAVADSVDAMFSNRPYRNGMSKDEIIAELNRSSGKQFDPEIVNVFLRIYS